METNNLILVEHICSGYEVEVSTIDEMYDHGLIEMITLENKKYISDNQIKRLESALSFRDELNINLEGIDVIFHLLDQINALQHELTITRNKLSLIDEA